MNQWPSDEPHWVWMLRGLCVCRWAATNNDETTGTSVSVWSTAARILLSHRKQQTQDKTDQAKTWEEDSLIFYNLDMYFAAQVERCSLVWFSNRGRYMDRENSLSRPTDENLEACLKVYWKQIRFPSFSLGQHCYCSLSSERINCNPMARLNWKYCSLISKFHQRIATLMLIPFSWSPTFTSCDVTYIMQPGAAFTLWTASDIQLGHFYDS